MSDKLVPRKDPGSRVVNALKTDGVTAGITAATIIGASVIPVFGWAVGLVGGGYLLYRSVNRGLKKDD